MTIDIDSTLNSENVPNFPKNVEDFTPPRKISEPSAHFYLGSSSGDGTSDQFFTELEINSRTDAYNSTHFFGEGGLYN